MSGLNIAVIEDAWLEGASTFDRWLQEDEPEIMAPLGRTVILLLEQQIKSMPPDQLAMLKASDPEAWAKFQEALDKIKAEGG